MADVGDGVDLDGAAAAEAAARLKAIQALPEDDREALLAICDANGMTSEHLTKRGPDKVRHVEMFMYNFPCMKGLRLFTNLTSLSIMQQKLSGINGLESCCQLKHVWIVECGISKISGLQTLKKLERLFLYGNRITKIENLPATFAGTLKTLWLCDNAIQKVENLAHLTELRELNLARNALTRCGGVLLANKKLVSLNVAANEIGTFRELKKFGRLINLKELTLQDPHYGKCPVTQLSNYVTLALCAVPKVCVLDTTPVTEETKALAAATTMKKKMFYETRLKKARRDADFSVKQGVAGKNAVLGELDKARVALERAIKHVEGCRGEARTGDTDDDAKSSQGDKRDDDAESSQKPKKYHPKLVSANLAKLKSARTSVLVETEATSHAFETCRLLSRSLADDRESRLMLELETGGNVRLEDGSPAKDWRDECAALVRSRFRGIGEKVAGDDAPRVSGLRVTRVTRITNRATRERFERAVVRRADLKKEAHHAAKLRRIERRAGRTKLLVFGGGGKTSSEEDSSSSECAASESDAVSESDPESDSADSSSSTNSDKETRVGDLPPKRNPGRKRQGGGIWGSAETSGVAKPAFADPLEKTEFLFVGVRDDRAARRIAEDGFSHDDWFEHGNGHHVVTLHDSVDLADAGRLAAELERHKRKMTFGDDPENREDENNNHAPNHDLTSDCAWMRGVLVVAKVRLGRTKVVAPGDDSSVVSPGKYPGFDSACRASAKHADQKSFHVFKTEDVVPEFAVEFIYEIVDADRSVNREVRAGLDVATRRYREWTDPRFVTNRCETALLAMPFEKRICARPMARFIGAAAKAMAAAGETVCVTETKEPEAEPPPGIEPGTASSSSSGDTNHPNHPTSRNAQLVSSYSWSASAAFQVMGDVFGFPYDGDAERALAAIELICARKQAWVSLGDCIRNQVVTQAIDPSSIQTLDVHGCGLTKIEPGVLSRLVNLQTLRLGFNGILRLENLDGLPNLTLLDVSHNLLKRIEGLAGLPLLTTLLLNDNKLFRVEDLNAMKHCCDGLLHLDLRNNALRENKAYSGLVLRRMSVLQTMDGIKVTPRDRQRAATSTTTLTAAMIKRFATLDEERVFRSGGGGLGTSVKATTPKNETESSPEDDDVWWSLVDSLTVRRKDLRRLSDLDKLINVRHVDFACNEIQKMEGLAALTRLETLNFEENRLSSIENCEQLRELRELNVARNKLVRLDNLLALSNLTRLSVEGNQISSLRGVSGLPNLCELYAGDNQIAETREIFHLKTVNKLVILDLTGNPVTRTFEYRPYVLFTLRRVKVLDGDGVDALEHGDARSRFAGRLTRDFLEVKFGRRHFRGVEKLDLRNSRLKELGDTFLASTEFDSVTELDFSENLFTKLDGVCALPNLTTLNVSGNKIEGNSLWSAEALAAAIDAETKRNEKMPKTTENAGTVLEKPGAALSTRMKDMRLTDTTVPKTSPGSKASLPLGGTNVFRTVEELAAEVAKSPEKEPADCETLFARKEPFPGLKNLDVSLCSVVTILTLGLEVMFETLTTLDLRGNDLTKIEGLDGLVNLTSLSLCRNRVKFVETHTFAGLPKLTSLKMEENGLRSLVHFDTLPTLKTLWLGGNRLVDASELEKLASLPDLVELQLQGNPLARKQVYRPMTLRHCEALQTLDQRLVTAHEREHVEFLFSPVDGGGFPPSFEGDDGTGGVDLDRDYFLGSSDQARHGTEFTQTHPERSGSSGHGNATTAARGRNSAPAQVSFPAVFATQTPARVSHAGRVVSQSTCPMRVAHREPVLLNNGARLGAGGDRDFHETPFGTASRRGVAGSAARVELANANDARTAAPRSALVAKRGKTRAPVLPRVFGMGPIDSFVGVDHGAYGVRRDRGEGNPRGAAKHASRKEIAEEPKPKTFREKFAR